MQITKTCPFTGKRNTIDLPITLEQWNQYASGGLAQNVFKNLNADEREFIISGVVPGDWDRYMKDWDEIEKGAEKDDMEDIAF